MAIKLNHACVARANKAIESGDVDHGEWSAPVGGDRTSDECLGIDSEAAPAAQNKYPVFSGSKVNRKALGSVAGYASTNGETEIHDAAMILGEKIDAKEKAKPAVAASASGPMLAQCPNCQSYDVARTPGGDRPTDACKNCKTHWPMKSGTLTASQHMGDDSVTPMMSASANRPVMILKLAADMEPSSPLGPLNNDAGQPIHYRRVKIARCGDWHHRGTGDPLSISTARADEWVKNTSALSSAGVRPFVPNKHTFGAFDAKDNNGYVISVDRSGDDVFATVALHGDDALNVAAKNERSVGIVVDAADANGKVYPGETLHHLALTPSGALPGLGGLIKIAASAGHVAVEIPIYELIPPKLTADVVAAVKIEPIKADKPLLAASSNSLPNPATGRKDNPMMTPEIAQKVRRALSLSVDVTDDNLPDVVAEKAMSLATELAARTTERDIAVADNQKKGEQVLSLSAELPKKPNREMMAMYIDNWQELRNHAIGEGRLTTPEMNAYESMFMEDTGTLTPLALSACGKEKKPLMFSVMRYILALSGNAPKLNAGTTRDPNFKVIDEEPRWTDERRNELLAYAGYRTPAAK